MDRVSEQPGVRLQIKTEGSVLDGLIDGFAGLPWRQSFVLSLPKDPAELGIHDHSIRKNVKRAKSLGLQVRTASSEDDLNKWYTLYLRTIRRVIVPPRPLRFFQGLWKYMQPLGLMNMMLAERHNGGKSELIAGLIFLLYRERFYASFLGCPSEHFYLRPNDLIHAEGIHWAVHNGFREYDFGEVPSGDTNLARFKLKWGAKAQMLYRYYYPELTRPESGVAESPGFLTQFSGAVWRRMPLKATEIIGDRIYSWL
jgi:hypothetical protein